jgi:hypothetical protein
MKRTLRGNNAFEPKPHRGAALADRRLIAMSVQSKRFHESATAAAWDIR